MKAVKMFLVISSLFFVLGSVFTMAQSSASSDSAKPTTEINLDNYELYDFGSLMDKQLDNIKKEIEKRYSAIAHNLGLVGITNKQTIDDAVIKDEMWNRLDELRAYTEKLKKDFTDLKVYKKKESK